METKKTVTEKVQEQLKYLGIAELPAPDSELGLDQLDRLELAMELEDVIDGLDVDDDAFSELDTEQDIVAYVCNQLKVTT